MSVEKYVKNNFEGFINGNKILFGGRTWKAFIYYKVINDIWKRLIIFDMWKYLYFYCYQHFFN